MLEELVARTATLLQPKIMSSLQRLIVSFQLKFIFLPEELKPNQKSLDLLKNSPAICFCVVPSLKAVFELCREREREREF